MATRAKPKYAHAWASEQVKGLYDRYPRGATRAVTVLGIPPTGPIFWLQTGDKLWKDFVAGVKKLGWYLDQRDCKLTTIQVCRVLSPVFEARGAKYLLERLDSRQFRLQDW